LLRIDDNKLVAKLQLLHRETLTLSSPPRPVPCHSSLHIWSIKSSCWSNSTGPGTDFRIVGRRAHSDTSYLFVGLNLLFLNSLSPRFLKGRHLVCRILNSSTHPSPSNPSPCGSLDNLWLALGTPHHSSLSDFVDIVDKRISDVCTLHRGRGERNHAQDYIQVN
jgi:hypothetical protein